MKTKRKSKSIENESAPQLDNESKDEPDGHDDKVDDQVDEGKYDELYATVENEVNQLRVVLQSVEAKEKECTISSLVIRYHVYIFQVKP